MDHDRLAMTGLSQAGYYTYYCAASLPDEFAAIVPESAGGMALKAGVLPLAQNLSNLSVRILHSQGDQIVPYDNAVRMKQALTAAGARVELITYTDADYGDDVFPQRHPGPHHLRLANVLPWAYKQKRSIPTSFTRVIRYRQQGHEGRFVLQPPTSTRGAFTVRLSEAGGTLTASKSGVRYLVGPEDVVAGKVFRVGDSEVKPTPDLNLLLSSFKASGDPGRLAAAEVAVTAPASETGNP